jgi:hypothetical protein
MGVDLVVAVDHKISAEDRLLITRLMGRTTENWTPYWGEETEGGKTYTYCFPGDRYIGIDSVYGPMNLHQVYRLASIWGAFTLVLKKASYHLFFLADYNTPTSYDEPVTRAYMRKLAALAGG